jgi:hypothetical protein
MMKTKFSISSKWSNSQGPGRALFYFQLPGQAGKILRREQAEIATMVIEGKRAEVNALADREDLNLFQRNSPFKEYFTGCRITPDGDFTVSDVIQKFKGCSEVTSREITRKVAIEKSSQLKRYQFRRKNNALGPAIPVGSFNVIIEILYQLSGKNAHILRREQAEIATMVMQGKRAEVNVLMDREEAKDVISPETPEVHNPVKDLNLFQRSSPFKEYFTDCRMTPDGDFAVSDVIQKFKGCSTRRSQELSNLVGEGISRQLKRYQFRRKNNALGPAIPVGSFNVIIEILSQLSGKNAHILRDEQVEIATMVIQGKRAEVNALMHREEAKDVISPETPEVHIPVKDLNLMNLSVEDFKDIRQEKGYFCVYDAIAQFKNCSIDRARVIFLQR